MTHLLSRVNKQTYVIFMALGFLLSCTVFELLGNWIHIFARIYDKPDLGYHELPLCVHAIQEAIRWLVWVVLGIILAVDLPKKEFSRTSGYITGILAAAVVILVAIAYRFSVAMEAF